MSPAGSRATDANPVGAVVAGLGRIVAAVPLAGGDIARVWRATLADGREVVVKDGPTAAELEAEGLDALRRAGGLVPDVLAVEGTRLVLDVATTRGDPAGFARMLARVHQHPAARFGWHRDNVLGPLAQVNTPTDDWPGFLAAARLLPHLDALDAAHPHGAHRPVGDRLRTAIEAGRVGAVLDHQPAARLVHGDLWSGNVLHWATLIDPAVHHADPELDLAMLALFGRPPTTFWAAYAEVAPLPDGAPHRRLVLQLPPLLAHVRLFGVGYLDGVVQRLDALGW